MTINVYDELNKIIEKYAIDAIWEIKGNYMVFKKYESVIWDDFIDHLIPDENISISLYGGGKWGKYVYEKLRSIKDLNIKNVIDNFQKWNEKIPTYTYEEWQNGKQTDRVLITNIKEGCFFRSQLYMDGYKGEVVDVFSWITQKYEDIEYIFPDYYDADKVRFIYGIYISINKTIRNYEKENKYKDLKKIIYGLFLIKDFYSAERYIEEVLRYNYNDYLKYRSAIKEVKSLLETAASNVNSDTIIINIIDSFSNSSIEKMSFLKKYANENLCITGIINHYPITSYALKTLFTGKLPFEVILEETKVSKKNSELLNYVQEEDIECHYVSSIINIKDKIKQEKNNIIVNDDFHNRTLTELLFEGLQLACKVKSKKIIFIHSCEEIHEPCFYVGSNRKEYAELTTLKKYSENRENTLCYIDSVLQWYYRFYDITKCSVVTMGDHGSDSVHDYETTYNGIKKDLAIATYERINPVFIVKAEGIKKEKIEGFIPHKNLQKILMMIMKHCVKDNISIIKSMITEKVELQLIPSYQLEVCKRYIPENRWGLYEGAIGLCTKDEIYLKYITGKEIYYRYKEFNYRNLINDNKFKNRINECRNMLEDKEDILANLYNKDKFKIHMECLIESNIEEFEIIMKKIRDMCSNCKN